MAINKLHGAEINGVGGRRSPNQRTEREAALDGRVTSRRYRIGRDPGRRRRARGGRRRPAGRSTRPGGGSASPSSGPRSSPAAPRSTPTASRSAPRTSRRAAAADAILLGAVGGPKWSDPSAPVRPEQALFALRGGLGLFANLRPVTVHPALVGVVAAPAGAARGRRPADRPRADRRRVLRRARRRPAARRATGRARRHDAVLARPRSGGSCRSRSSWRATGAARVTSVDKANVLATSRLWRKVVDEVRRRLPGRRGEPPAGRLVRDAARQAARPTST